MQHAEERGSPGQAGDPLRIAFAADRDTALLVKRELLEDVSLTEPVVIVGHTGARALDPGFRIAVVDQHQALGVRHRQGAEQDRVDDGEDDRVGADAERQREQRRHREGAVLQQQAKGEAKVLAKAFHSDQIRKWTVRRSSQKKL